MQKEKRYLISDRAAKNFGLAAFTICLLIQVAYIIAWWGTPPLSDCGTHFMLADYCVQHGEWYPAQKDIYHVYILAPTLINYYALQLRMFGSLDYNSLINLVIACVITYEIWLLTLKLFSRRTAWLAVGVWSLLYSTWTSVVPAATELPFLVLALGGVCLSFSRKWVAVVLAGIAIALANTVRPLVVVFIPLAVAIMYKSHYSLMRYVTAGLACAATVLIVGMAVYAKIGYFVPQSSTGGLNLALTANSSATGNYAAYYNDPENEMYIEDMQHRTFAEKDSIWKARSIEWIKEHPGRYARLYLKKLAGMYSHDAVFEGYLYEDAIGYSASVARGISYRDIMLQKMSKSVWYYCVLAMCLATLVSRRRELLGMKGMVLSVTVLGTAVTALFSTMTRYHYPLMFPVVIWAAYGISLLRKRVISD